MKNNAREEAGMFTVIPAHKPLECNFSLGKFTNHSQSQDLAVKSTNAPEVDHTCWDNNIASADKNGLGESKNDSMKSPHQVPKILSLGLVSLGAFLFFSLFRTHRYLQPICTMENKKSGENTSTPNSLAWLEALVPAYMA